MLVCFTHHRGCVFLFCRSLSTTPIKMGPTPCPCASCALCGLPLDSNHTVTFMDKYPIHDHCLPCLEKCPRCNEDTNVIHGSSTFCWTCNVIQPRLLCGCGMALGKGTGVVRDRKTGYPRLYCNECRDFYEELHSGVPLPSV